MNEEDIREIVLTSVRSILGSPQRYDLIWQRLPATVVDGTTPSAVSIIIDGGTTEVPAVSLAGGFRTGARVMVDYIPPSGLYIMGQSPASASPGYRFVDIVTFTTTTAITASDYTGIQAVRQRMVGGGGGGGGVPATAAGQAAAAAGGGGGGYSETLIASPSFVALTVNIGAAGTGGAAGANNGTAGGQTTGLGSFVANGGGGGEGGTAAATGQVTAGGMGGTATGDIGTFGGDGGNGMRVGGFAVQQGFGGWSQFGGSRQAPGNNLGGAGATAHLYGGGGSGAFNQASQAAAAAGGNGTAGLIVWELYV